MARGDTRVRVRSRASEPAEREAPRRSERGGTASRFSAELRARSSETRFTLDLVTADGDLVRIDFSSLESRLRLRGAAFGEDGLLAAFAGRARGSVRELAFEVQGELDDEELAQIREFVRDVLKAGRRALRDDGDAFARLARQGVEASEIASFALDYRRTETKLLAKYRTVAGAGNEAAAPASLDADSARAVGRLADEARSLTDQGSRVLLRASAETLVARVLGEAVKPVQVPAEELAEEAVAAALDGGPEPAAAPASASEAAPADDD
jgi:methyl-accepting chemotaxis protein